MRSQPNHSHSPSPNMHSNQPFVFAPHRSPPLSPQPPPHHHQHTPHHYQHSPHQHSLSRTLSAEAESPAETQVYSLRSRLAPRVPAEPSGLQQTHDQLQRPVHKVHHFFTCHTEQVTPLLPIANSPMCYEVVACADCCFRMQSSFRS